MDFLQITNANNNKLKWYITSEWHTFHSESFKIYCCKRKLNCITECSGATGKDSDIYENEDLLIQSIKL